MTVAARSAFHLRGTDRKSVDLVDGWLVQHHFKVNGAPDALTACAHLVLAPKPAPMLAFISTDLFGPRDMVLLEHLRETWPRTGLVLYGAKLYVSAASHRELTLVAPSRARLRGLLANSPEALRERLLRLSLPHNGGGPEVSHKQPPAPAPSKKSATAMMVGSSGLQAGLREEKRKKAGDDNVTPPTTNPRLTPDELSTLLGD